MDTSSGYQVVGSGGTITTLEVGQVVVAPPAVDTSSAQLHYLTESAENPAEWFVIHQKSDEEEQVITTEGDSAGGGADASALSRGERCLVCGAGLTAGWLLQNCTKRGQVMYATLLMDVLHPANSLTNLSGFERVCEVCTSILDEVDEYGCRLRDAQARLRNKYKRVASETETAAESRQTESEQRRTAGTEECSRVVIVTSAENEAILGLMSASDSKKNIDDGNKQVTKLETTQREDKRPIGGDLTEPDAPPPSQPAWPCVTCLRPFPSELQLSQHQVSDHGAPPPSGQPAATFSCHCGLTLDSAKELETHKRSAHRESTSYRCAQCSLTLKTPKLFMEHMKKHGETHPFKCDQCDKRFTLQSSLTNHSRLHTGDTPYRCELCDRGFRQHTSLQSHRRTHTNQRPYKCDVCQRSFREPHALKVHKLIHSGEKPHQCELCEMRFRQKGVMQRHMRTHTGERPYPCDRCDMRFIDSSALKIHMVQHTGQKPFYCEHCGKGFSDSFWFNKHKMYHNGERPHKCDLCSKAFTDARILRQHKKMHAGDKPFICSVCGARFQNSSHLTRHGFIHSGAKPFTCDICHQSYRDKSTLKRHQTSHADPRRHKCTTCGRFFDRRDALDAHDCQGRTQDALSVAVSAAAPAGFLTRQEPKQIFTLKTLEPIPGGASAIPEGLETAVIQLQPLLTHHGTMTELQLHQQPLQHHQDQSHHLMQTYQQQQ